ncbi:hypothetical protein CERZMDRAFT_58200 [Cercospora zeae-maydis SCOH1-5]|uniref:Uncharacterized protein n=1 Tax=Cercospora zeae-maydis SCOH1-5 TaxID=717836 RepID=A0A6A6FJ25_9PEZI|nr:hypothetical protein CERZMDRAFT_58200 [Cercospora zeae-maydis SCOH1-5]
MTLLTAIKRRWDSSDPERAPPPLPLNPSTGSSPTKANTSAGIAAAAKAIVEKARESAPISSYTQNKSGAEERSLVKGAHHKRMQSLQTSPVKDLRSYLENRSPERSPERPNSRHSWMPGRMSSIEDLSPSPQCTTPTPAEKERDAMKDTPMLRPTTRQRSIYGENTPPSATMLALQTMQVPDAPLNDITNVNGPTTPNNPRVHTSYDFSSQLLNLTTIATNLQNEMKNLSRRSKDNATDLLTLKEATNSRDEDIRKSLRELASSVSAQNLLPPPPVGSSARSMSSFSHYIDSKPFGSPPSAGKSYSVPRAASAHSFLDEPRCGSPSPYSVEGAASVAMLEKIIREMVTKDGQDRLLTTLSELLERSGKENKEAKKKIEELTEFIRERSESHALVPVSTGNGGPPKLELNFDSPTPKGRDPSYARRDSNDEELLRLLGRIKDSVTHSGGTTSEVKGLVRDLRGEVLGMGRELGKKLDQIGEAQLNSSLDKSIREGRDNEHLEEVQQIVQEAMSELKQSLAGIMKERAEQDDDTFKQLAVVRSGPDADEMLATVQRALAEHNQSLEKSRETDVENLGIDREGVLAAVKEGLQDFEPNIELQQFGLERDEILAVLKEGLEQHRENRAEPAPPPIDKGEIYEVMQEALKDFHAPLPTEQLDQLKEELIANVRQALEEFTPPSAEAPITHDAMNAMVLAAVTSGLAEHGPSAPRELEISRDDLFDAVKAGLDDPFGGFSEQVLKQLGDLIDEMRVEFKQYSAANGRDTEQVLDAIKDGHEALRHEIETYVDRAQDVTGKDEIVDTVKTGLERLREDVKAFCAEGPSHDGGRAEMLEYIRAEFEQLHGTIKENGSARDTLQAIRASLDEVKETVGKNISEGISTEQLEAIRGEFENLRNSIATNAAHAGSNEEVLDAMHLGLDDLRSHLEKKLDNPETVIQHQGQVLDALNEGLETLRADIVKTLDKPLDQTVNYEILETLKDGLAELRTELDKLKSSEGDKLKGSEGGEIVLADGLTRELSAEDVAAAEAASKTTNSAQKADIEGLEVLLAQVQIKIEAMDHAVQSISTEQAAPQVPEGIALKEDLTGLESMVRELQESVLGMSSKSEERSPEGAALKEDTDAIETLLRNTKAQLEEMVLPDPSTAASKDHLDEIQVAVAVANEALVGITDKLDNSAASKADVAVVEVLVTDIKNIMDELKEKQTAADAEEKPETMTKSDLDVLGLLCTEIKTSVSELHNPDPASVPTKADVEQLQGLINDFRESHDKMRDSYETDIAVTAKAFDDRKKEFDDTIAQIDEVKSLIAEIKVELLEKVAEGETGINALGVTLKGLEERSDNEAVVTEVKEVMEKLKEEFEKAHASIEAIKVDHAASSESALEKQSEHKDAVVSELAEKLENSFGALMSKYDDAQTAAEEKSKTLEENVTKQEELLNSTKEMADDLKLSIDTLGSTLTAFIGDLPAQVERMTEESKTVFAQGETTQTKLEEAAETLRNEHATTRSEVARILAAVDVLQSDMSEHNPRFMVTLEEVRALISQHYEHSQKAYSAAEEQAQAKSLPMLMPPPVEVPAPVEKYDDSVVREKLDQLMTHVEEAKDRSAQLERLDEIHAKVMATATEVSAFVVAQNKQIEDSNESKEKEAEEIALLLERRLERKDQLEADITVLNEEKMSLQAAVEQLKAEKDALATQKSRLNADVFAMETALQIRRDELHEMDNKAAAIERRMLEGVMNQSRMLLLTKSKRSAPSSPKKKSQGRDLRIPSDTSADSGHTVTSSAPLIRATHALAMKARPNLLRNGGVAPNTAERRIMSLNQINHNVPTGAHAYSSDKPSLMNGGGLGNVKRSHSVKHNFMHKPSWTERKQRVASLASTTENKENELSEEEEDGSVDASPQEFGSEVGTTRRTSLLSGTDGSMSYATGSYVGEGETPDEDGHRRSLAPSDMTYETGSYLSNGSYMTGTDLDRRTSIGSSANGQLGMTPLEHDAQLGAINPSELSTLPRSSLSTVPEGQSEEVMGEMDDKDLKRCFAPSSDSGLGTDCPTTACESGAESGGSAVGYFVK